MAEVLIDEFLIPYNTFRKTAPGGLLDAEILQEEFTIQFGYEIHDPRTGKLLGSRSRGAGDEVDAAFAKAVGGVTPERGSTLGNASGSRVYASKLKDGTDVIVREDVLPDGWGRHGHDQGKADHVLNGVFRELGIEAPTSTLLSDGTEVMTFVGGHKTNTLGRTGLDAVYNSPKGRQVALVDLVSGQMDRHEGNFHVSDTGEPMLFDSGDVWSSRSPDSDFDYFNTAFLRPDSPPFTSEEMATVRAAVERNAPRARRSHFEDLHLDMLERLTTLESNGGDWEALLYDASDAL